MRPKLKPIKPKNIINKKILEAIIKKQDGSDSLYATEKNTIIPKATLRRILETEHTWTQALYLFDICRYCKIDIINLLTLGMNEMKKNSKFKN